MNRSHVAFAVVIVLMALVGWSQPAVAETTLYSVAGKVTSDEGKPLAGVTIYGSTYSETGAGSDDKEVTAEDGSYVLKLAAGRGRIAVQHPEWNAYDGREITVDGDETGVDFTLKTPPPRTAIVEGRVLDAAGQPVAGATVRLDQGCCYLYETPPEPATRDAAPPSDASSGGTEPAQGGSGSASATSYYGRDDVAVMPVCCYDYGQTQTTGEDGAFRFETYGGPRQLTAGAKGYAQTTVQVDAKDGTAIKQDIMLLKVPPADAVLRGRVTDAATGLPIANAQVNLANLEWSRYEYATTDAAGRYEITTIPGWSTLSVYPGYGYPEPMPVEGDALTIAKPVPTSGPSYYQYTVGLRVASGEATRDVKLEPKPAPDVVLQGYVVDPDAQKGIPGATVNVWNQDTGDWGSAVTDETGSYKMLVRPGHYTANAWAEGHLQGAVTFVIAEGEDLKRVDLDAPKGETRSAPCDACYDDRVYAAEGGAGASSGSATIATREASTMQAGKSAPTAAPMAASDEDGRTSATAYAGSGGGLPEYNPAEAPRTEEGIAAAKEQAPVPAPGALLVVAAVGLAALVLARRRA